MKKVFQLRYKAKAAVLLLIMMALLILNNLVGRGNYSNLDKSISAIYQDRLMPATYIFQISDHLYQKRLLLEEASNKTQSLLNEIKTHDAAIAGIVDSYEKTHLTREEERQWVNFKNHLMAYNTSEGANSETSDREFNEVMHSLNSLTQLQVGEGTLLQKDAKAIISGSNLMSQFEISILVILGLFVVVLISKPEKLYSTKEHYSLN